MNESKRISPKIISIIVIVLIAAASTGVYAATQSSKKADDTATTSQTTDSTAGTTDTSDNSANDSTATNATYKDGSYTETGNYITPGGGEDITVTVTLANGTITDVSATGSATTGDAKGYQTEFLNGYKSQVVGKSIDAVKLSRVSGSSLTSNGFNSALTKIKTDASA